MKHTPWIVEYDNDECGQWFQAGPAVIRFGYNKSEDLEFAREAANLIAAAPELLEALREMVDCYWGTEEDPAQGNAVARARAAIAKAEGAA